MEDSGEGDGSGEQTDVTAGQSESTDGNEERGVGRAEAADNEGHHGESSTVQARTDASQEVSLQGLLATLLLLPLTKLSNTRRMVPYINLKARYGHLNLGQFFLLLRPRRQPLQQKENEH